MTSWRTSSCSSTAITFNGWALGTSHILSCIPHASHCQLASCLTLQNNFQPDTGTDGRCLLNRLAPQTQSVSLILKKRRFLSVWKHFGCRHWSISSADPCDRHDASFGFSTSAQLIFLHFYIQPKIIFLFYQYQIWHLKPELKDTF